MEQDMGRTQREVTQAEAAEILGCSRENVRQLCARFELTYRREGHHVIIPLAEVEAYQKRKSDERKERDRKRAAKAQRLAANAAKVTGTGRRR